MNKFPLLVPFFFFLAAGFWVTGIYILHSSFVSNAWTSTAALFFTFVLLRLGCSSSTPPLVYLEFPLVRFYTTTGQRNFLTFCWYLCVYNCRATDEYIDNVSLFQNTSLHFQLYFRLPQSVQTKWPRKKTRSVNNPSHENYRVHIAPSKLFTNLHTALINAVILNFISSGGIGDFSAILRNIQIDKSDFDQLKLDWPGPFNAGTSYNFIFI